MALATLAGAAVALLVGGLAGVVAGVGTIGAVTALLARAEDPAQRRLRERRTAELAGCLDLFAVCLRTGLPPPRALALVAELPEGPLATDLKAVAALQALGVPARAAWAEHAADPVLGQVARAVARTADSGAALAGSVERVAAETRAEARQAAEAGARRAGVAVLAPLGLCFLPAFVCLGVIPIVLGIAEDVLW